MDVLTVYRVVYIWFDWASLVHPGSGSRLWPAQDLIVKHAAVTWKYTQKHALVTNSSAHAWVLSCIRNNIPTSISNLKNFLCAFQYLVITCVGGSFPDPRCHTFFHGWGETCLLVLFVCFCYCCHKVLFYTNRFIVVLKIDRFSKRLEQRFYYIFFFLKQQRFVWFTFSFLLLLVAVMLLYSLNVIFTTFYLRYGNQLPQP